MSMDAATLTSGADQAYFEGLLEGEVRLQSCNGCGEYHWPAVFRCSRCGSWDHAWGAVTPAGDVYSWTRTWHSFGGAEGFTPPFVSLVVTLKDVPAVRLIGVLEGHESGLAIGASVAGRVHTVDFQGRPIPALSWSLV